MIRKKHNIDTILIETFIRDNKFDEAIYQSFLNWYHSLGDKDHQVTRNNAIDFLKKISFEVLNEISYPMVERNELIETFGPLELLLRLALSLKSLCFF